MADPYTGTSDLLSEDIPSSYFQNLLQNSSSGVPILGSKPSEDSAAGGLFFRQDCRVRNAAAIESSSGFNLSDPGCFYSKESIMNPVGSVGVGNSDEITSAVKDKSFSARNDGSEVGGDRKGEQAREASVVPVPPRSSKRSRAPEVHNLSEKRRRSRINEKMKALQNLIPNSNKTDKASMLDEAIEYLKQLQLKVQMLTMRNGLSFPIYLPGSLQAIEPPQTGMHFDDRNVFPDVNRDAEAYSRDHEISVRTLFDSSSHTAADPALAVPMIPDITNTETSFCLDSSIKHQIAPKMTNHPNCSQI